MHAANTPKGRERSWLHFYETLQGYLIRNWWPRFCGCEVLPTPGEMRELGERLKEVMSEALPGTIAEAEADLARAQGQLAAQLTAQKDFATER